MELFTYLDLNAQTVIALFVVGFIGGMVSGFIGSGGAFVLTPAMMSLGVPAIVAVASNMAHKFPKALVGAIKRNQYGQVDVKLGIAMGIFAEVGVFAGKQIMTAIRHRFGDIGTDLYVSIIFVVALAIVGGFIMRDVIRSRKLHKADTTHTVTRLAKWVQSVHIPGTMMYFRSINAEVSLVFVAVLGFATGMLAASIAVGGFIGVPAMIYVLGAPALMASATELVVAFIMGMGGTMFYAWEGFVDIRLAMIILAGSLFGIQIGAVGTTYVKDHTVKLVMGLIMVIVLVSRLFKLPLYLADLHMIQALPETLRTILDTLSLATLGLALAVGAITIVVALLKGMAEHRQPKALPDSTFITQ